MAPPESYVMVNLCDYNRLPWFWDVLESIRPATNFPGIVVDPNRVNRMVGKSGLVPDSSTERGMPVAH